MSPIPLSESYTSLSDMSHLPLYPIHLMSICIYFCRFNSDVCSGTHSECVLPSPLVCVLLLCMVSYCPADRVCVCVCVCVWAVCRARHPPCPCWSCSTWPETLPTAVATWRKTTSSTGSPLPMTFMHAAVSTALLSLYRAKVFQQSFNVFIVFQVALILTSNKTV